MGYVGEHRFYLEKAIEICAISILKKCPGKTIKKLKEQRYSDLDYQDILENEVDNFIRDFGKWAIKKALKDKELKLAE